jgi:hypothetical protein
VRKKCGVQILEEETARQARGAAAVIKTENPKPFQTPHLLRESLRAALVAVAARLRFPTIAASAIAFAIARLDTAPNVRILRAVLIGPKVWVTLRRGQRFLDGTPVHRIARPDNAGDRALWDHPWGRQRS